MTTPTTTTPATPKAGTMLKLGWLLLLVLAAMGNGQIFPPVNGGSPSGSAGGCLAGSYPNPTISSSCTGIPASGTMFTQLGTGTVASTLAGYAQQRRSIADFGAVADNTTDNATAIQAAFTWAAGQPGATLDVPCNSYSNYLVKSPLVLPSYTMVRGGADNNCTILYNPSSNPGTVVAAFNGIGTTHFISEGINWQTGSAWPPNTIMVLARNLSNVGGYNRISRSTIYGYAQMAALYGISSENTLYERNQIYLIGGGASYVYYTSGQDDLSVCGGICNTASNLGVWVSDGVFSGASVTNAAAVYAVGDLEGGGIGGHYYKNLYLALNQNSGSEGFRILSGAAGNSGPNDLVDIQDVRMEQGGYGIHFVLNSQASINNVEIKNFTLATTFGTYYLYGDTGLTLFGCTWEGTNAQSNANASSVDTLNYSAVDLTGYSSGEVFTVRTSATGNVLNPRHNASFSLPSTPGVTNALFDGKGNLGTSACWTVSAFCVIDDFIGGQLSSGNIGSANWSTASIGAAPNINPYSTTNFSHPGGINFQTGSTSGQGGTLYLANSNASSSGIGQIGSNAGWTSTWILTGLSTNIRYRVGFATPANTSAVPVSGIYFCFDTSSGCGALSAGATTWAACVDSSSTETCFNTGVTVTTSFFKFSIASATAANISFWINGGSLVTVCAACSNAATPPTNALAPSLITVTNTASALTASVDYFLYELFNINR